MKMTVDEMSGRCVLGGCWCIGSVAGTFGDTPGLSNGAFKHQSTTRPSQVAPVWLRCRLLQMHKARRQINQERARECVVMGLTHLKQEVDWRAPSFHLSTVKVPLD